MVAPADGGLAGALTRLPDALLDALRMLRSRGSGRRAQKRVQRDVLEKSNLDAKSDSVAQVSAGAQMPAAGAEFGQTEVPGPSQFEACGNKRRIKVDDRVHLDLDVERGHGRRVSLSVDNPSAAIGEDMSEPGEMTLTVVIREALDIERAHSGIDRPQLEFLPSDPSSEPAANS